MNPMNVTQALAAHPFCNGLSEAVLKPIGSLASCRVFAAGSYLVKEPQPADCFLLIQSGHVAIEIHSPRGGSKAIQTLGPGEVVGWSWLVPPHHWHFDARALEPVQAIALDGTGLRKLCQENPEIGSPVFQRLLGVLAGRLAATRLQLLDEMK